MTPIIFPHNSTESPVGIWDTSLLSQKRRRLWYAIVTIAYIYSVPSGYSPSSSTGLLFNDSLLLNVNLKCTEMEYSSVMSEILFYGLRSRKHEQ